MTKVHHIVRVEGPSAPNGDGTFSIPMVNACGRPEGKRQSAGNADVSKVTCTRCLSASR